MKRPSLLWHVRTPLTLMATAGLAVAVLAVSVVPASAGKGHGSPARKPTVVLVHGAFADSGSWDGVVKRLKRDGYPVVAAANPLRGLAGDAAYVKEIVAGIEGPVVLVGHSYGGLVISDAATGSANVKALVYVAAFLPEKGESAFDLSAKFPGSTLGDTLNAVPITLPDGSKDVDLTIDPARFHDQFAADVPRDVTDLMAVSQRPITNAALREGAGEPAWKAVPSWVLVATQDRNIPPQVQRFMAERARAHTAEVRSSHAVSVSHPGDVAEIIERAAAGTAG